MRTARRLVVTAAAMAVILMAIVACGGGGDGETTEAAATTSDQGAATTEAGTETASTSESSGENIELTMWFWGELDAPGANDWLQAAADSYHEEHPNVTIKIVEQATETFIESFQTAASAKEGPDIAAQWATGPVLTQVWAGAIAPLSDLVPADEIAHWLNTSENTFDGKVWAMPVYLLGLPWAYNKDLFAQAGIDSPPATWDEFIASCQQLRDAGITPLAFGNDAYWTTQLMLQSLDSLQDVVDANVGKQSFTDPKFASFEDAWKQAVDAQCFNEDIASVDLSTGQEQFAAGKAAMTIGTDGQVRTWAKDVGADKVGVFKWPVYGDGALKDVYDATQSTSYFVTSWTEYPQDAADFLVYLHSPEQIDAWFEATGVPPADDRFDTAKITDPLDKELFELATTGPQVWLQNFFPPQIDLNGNKPAQELIFSGQGDGAQAAEVRQRAAEAWKQANPEEVQNWESWQPPDLGS